MEGKITTVDGLRPPIKICGCIAEHNLEDILRAINEAVQNGAGLIELRLDRIGNIDHLEEIIEASDVPVVATDRKNKNNLILAIEAGCNFVDVELETNKKVRSTIIKKARGHGCKVIISKHDFRCTPSNKTLLRIIHQEKEVGADIGKIVTMANSIEDCHRILGLIIEAEKIDFPLLAFAMGDVGRFTRVIAPLFGAPFTYASIDKPVEPGQLSVVALKRIYKGLVP